MGATESIEWDLLNAHMFFAGSEDGKLTRWDERQESAVQSVVAHKGGIRAVAPNYYNEHLVSSCGQDGVVMVWDLRSTTEPCCQLKAHTDGVLSVAWSPFHEKVLGSAGNDKRVHLWDIDDCTAAAASTPLFTHVGHRESVTEISWNLNDPWNLASVSVDNTLQIWTPAEKCLMA